MAILQFHPNDILWTRADVLYMSFQRTKSERDGKS